MPCLPASTCGSPLKAELTSSYLYLVLDGMCSWDSKNKALTASLFRSSSYICTFLETKKALITYSVSELNVQRLAFLVFISLGLGDLGYSWSGHLPPRLARSLTVSHTMIHLKCYITCFSWALALEGVRSGEAITSEDCHLQRHAS